MIKIYFWLQKLVKSFWTTTEWLERVQMQGWDHSNQIYSEKVCNKLLVVVDQSV